MMRQMQLSYAYDTRLLKNRAKTIRGRGAKKFICLSNEYRRAKQELASALQIARGGMHFREKFKTHVEILVVRPDMRADPANFIDGICDAIKTVIGVDDRYYSLEVDYELDRDKPRIDITISQ